MAEVVVQQSKALVLAGRNGRFPIGPSPGIKDLWVKLMEDFGRIEGQVDLKSYGVCHNFDGAGHMDYLASVEVANAGAVPGYLHTLIIPARKVAVFRHHGPLAELSATWAAIFNQHLPAAKLKVAVGPQFEVYSADFDAEEGNGFLDIHIPVE